MASRFYITCQVASKNTQTHVHCYLQLKLFGKQQTVDLFALYRQTAVTVWHLHMNGGNID